MQERLIYLDGKKIDISGPKGNAYVLLGMAQDLMRQCGVAKVDISEFLAEATSGDYDHLCETVTAATGIQLVMGNDSDYL